MFFNNTDPRTQLQARLNCESRAQAAGDTSCEETNFTNGGSTIPGGDGSDGTTTISPRPLFGSGTPDSASKTRLVRTARR